MERFLTGRRQWLAGLLAGLAGACAPRQRAGLPRPKVIPMQKLFRIPFGDGPGRLHYRSDPAGVELDLFPGRFVRDRRGRFAFLEAAPFSRVCYFSPSGQPLSQFPVAKLLPASLAGRTVEPREIFLTVEDTLAILLTVSHEESTDACLLFMSAEGSLANLVSLPEFDAALFGAGESALDAAGYLWAMHAGGRTRVYDSEGGLFSEFEVLGSFVDPAGLMYTVTDPIRLCDREGQEVKELVVEGTETPPDSIDGGNRRVVFHVRRGEDSLEDGRWRTPWSLYLYRVDKTAGRLTFVKELRLPDSLLDQPDLGVDIVFRHEVWGPRLVLDLEGSLYLLGRSEEACWLARLDTGVT